MNSESRLTFFRQSGWLVISNCLSGACLMGVIVLLGRMVPEEHSNELGVYFALLRFFTVLAIPAAGLQVAFAQQAAGAINEEQERLLRISVGKIGRLIISLWAVICILCTFKAEYLKTSFKFTDSWGIAITLCLVLMQLLLPLLQGLLQGGQNFAYLGWSIMLNGVGRFVGIFLMIYFFRPRATEALAGALIGLGSAVLVGFWPLRNLFRVERGTFDWIGWFKRVLPLTGGVGASLFLMNADVLFVQRFFPTELSKYYSAAAVVGVGLVAFSTPLAAVMFPKLVRSFAQSQESNSLQLALIGTAFLGAIAALICTLWPSLPLRIMFFNKPEFWKSSILVPWFLWAMLPLTIANVLISRLLALSQFKAVPWLVLIGAGYGLTQYYYLSHVEKNDYFHAFRGVVQILGCFSLMILIVALVYSRGRCEPDTRAA
jgi:O-antigen/teichoic acid export membrane protein